MFRNVGSMETIKKRGPRPRHNDPDPTTTGENLRAARLSRGVTQSELATALGYRTHVMVARIESGFRGMTDKRLHDAAAFLGVAPSVIRQPAKVKL